MKKKRILCLFLSLSLLFLLSCTEEYPEPVFDPQSVKEEEKIKVGMEEKGGIIYTLYNDMTCAVTELNKEGLESLSLVIPSSYAKYTVVEIVDEVFREADLIRVTLPETIKTIGSRAFQKCTLEEINLPNSLTSIGTECFDNCLNLKSVTIGKGLKEIPLGAFSGCRKLESVTLPEGVEKIGEEAFSSLSALKTLTLPESLREIGPYAFFSAGTDDLQIKIPENVEKIEKDAFRGTAFLKNQTEEFVLAGKGILLSYNGNKTDLTLPDTVKYLSNAFDKSAVKDLTLNPGLTGICPNAFEESPVESLVYSGSNSAVSDFVNAFTK